MPAEVVKLDAPVGAEIRGIDLAEGLGDADFQVMWDALHEHSVIFLRGQSLTPEQHIAASGRFGSLEHHVLPQFRVAGHPELVRISNILDEQGNAIGVVDAGQVWHSDGMFAERPNMYSMLYSIEVPRDDEGRPLGSTHFVSTADAYDLLPVDIKKTADAPGLKGVNSMAAIYKALGEERVKRRGPLTEEQKREVIHPVIRTHPVTGRRCIYVSRAATIRIEGLPSDESETLIDQLSRWCIRDEMVYRHEWRVGDVLMWDNCSAQHLAIGDYKLPQRRLMHRTTIAGSVPY